MTPDQYQAQQDAAAAAVTAELQAYRDQLVPGAPELLGRRWVEMGKFPADKRSEAIAQRVASPLADQWREPRYDATSPDAPTPLERAIAQQGHRLKPGAAAELAKQLAPELAGRNPAKMAGEVARHLERTDNHRFLKDAPAAPAHVGRLESLLNDNFRDVLPPSGVSRLVADRGREFARMSDRQVIGAVAGSLAVGSTRDRYSASGPVPAGDARHRGGPPQPVTGDGVMPRGRRAGF